MTYRHSIIASLTIHCTLMGCGDGEPSRSSPPSFPTGGHGGATQAETSAGGASGGQDGATETTAEGGQTNTSTRMATPLLVSSNLWISRDGNPLAIQGSWTGSTGSNSTLALTVQDGRLCLSGSTATVPLVGATYDYDGYFGAIANLNLCRSASSDAPPDTSYTLSGCPWSSRLASSFAGVRFMIPDDARMPRELRVVFKERNRTTARYVVVQSHGPVTALVADATLPSNPSAPPVDIAALEAIQIYAYPSRDAKYAFDLCLGQFEILTGSGWSAIPDWVFESGPGLQVQYGGVNLAGAEFGDQKLPGVYGTDYVYPSDSDVATFAKAHMNVIRLPFRWERLQRSLGAELDATELSRLQHTVRSAVERNMTVVLDLHNFGRYRSDVVGGAVSMDDFADFWRRLATVYANDDRVIFGLMNEPHDMPSTESWLTSANAAIAAIRSTGARNLILVPGNAWTGAHSWSANYYGSSNATTMLDVADQANHFAFEFHQYLDDDSSGRSATCVSPSIGIERVTQATEWLKAHHFSGFLGEFNGGANETCYLALDSLLTYLGQNADVWLGWSVWAGGPWWGENFLSVQPAADGKDRPQMSVLKRHLPSR
ncbi:MAG: glycoside hydrolase family 5 protein [Polyangiaceae bacterium]